MSSLATSAVNHDDRWRSLLGVLLACALLSLTLSVGVDREGKSRLVILACLVGLILFPIAVRLPGMVERIGLFAMALFASIGLKFHISYRADHMGGSIGLRIAAVDLLLLFLFVWRWFFSQPGRRSRIWIQGSLLAALAAHLLISAVSTLAGDDLELGFYQISANLQAYLLFFFLTNYLDSAARVRPFLLGLVAALVIQSGIAILQVEKPGMVKLAFLGATEEQGLEMVRGKIDLPDVDRGATILEEEVIERPTGLLIHPNVLGLYLVVTVPLALGFWLAADGLWSWLALASASLGFIALYLSLSRSSWVGMAAALGVGALFLRRHHLLRITPAKSVCIVIGLLTVVIAAAWRFERILERLSLTVDEAVDFRASLNTAAIGMLAEHPFLGIGLNSFVEQVGQYDTSGLSRIKAFPVHNIFLMEFSELGIPGGVAFIVILWIAGRLAYRSAAASPTSKVRLFLLFVIAGFAGFFVGDMANFVYRLPLMTSYLWCLLAAILAVSRLDLDEAYRTVP